MSSFFVCCLATWSVASYSYIQNSQPYQSISSWWRSVFLYCQKSVKYSKIRWLKTALKQVILDEIGWLNFYSAYNNQLCQERRISKHPPIQAEKEITLHAVFTVCYDVILGYAHCSNSSHQALGSDLLDFLLKRWSINQTCQHYCFFSFFLFSAWCSCD